MSKNSTSKSRTRPPGQKKKQGSKSGSTQRTSDFEKKKKSGGRNMVDMRKKRGGSQSKSRNKKKSAKEMVRGRSGGGSSKSKGGSSSSSGSKRAPIKKEPKKKKSGFSKLMGKLCGGSVAQLDFTLEPFAQVHADSIGLLPIEIKKLRYAFMQIDYDESGEVDADEFLEFVDERRSPFTDHIFKHFDSDGSGEVDFNEFIGVCCTYCMLSKQELLRFTFDSFDLDQGGTLDEEEFMILCKAVNNMNPTFPGNFTTALEEFDQNDDGLIDFDEFQDLNRHYPLVLFPAFRLQDRIQKVTLGEVGWVSVAKRCAKSKYILEYMKLHGGDPPPESFITRLFRCFGTTSEMRMALKKVEEEDGGPGSPGSPK